MDTATLILQIFTILISITSMVIAVSSEFRENRKKNYIGIVTKQRIINKDCIRNYSQILLQNTHIAILPHATVKNLEDCIGAVSGIEVVFKNIYSQEKTFIDKANSLVGALSDYLNDKTDITLQNLLQNRNEFYKIYSIYDLSDWRFIKAQSIGKEIDSEDFDRIYENTEKTFNEKR